MYPISNKTLCDGWMICLASQKIKILRKTFGKNISSELVFFQVQVYMYFGGDTQISIQARV